MTSYITEDWLQICVCVWHLCGVRDGKKRKGESKREEEWLREERWMLCQHVVLMQLVWVTLSHLCGSCKSSQSFGRLATEGNSTTVMLKAGSSSIGRLIESCSHADPIKVLCSWIVGTMQHHNSLCMALHGSLSTRLSALWTMQFLLDSISISMGPKSHPTGLWWCLQLSLNS